MHRPTDELLLSLLDLQIIVLILLTCQLSKTAISYLSENIIIKYEK